jgi:hypothetical protein
MRPLVLVLGIALGARAQQPFLTDDADVTDVRHYHLELLTEHDVLQPGAYPALRQNTTRLQVTYGLMNRRKLALTIRCCSSITTGRPELETR